MLPDLVIEDVRAWDPIAGELDADCVVVRGERIAAIGQGTLLRDTAGPDTQILSGRGRFLMPAFQDSHTHFQRASISRRFYLDLEQIPEQSVACVLDAVRTRAEAEPAGAWIQADGLVADRLAERRFPHRLELDTVVPDHPVVLRGVGRHSVVANSLALSLAGISRDTPDPPGGHIGRDDGGELTGALYERGKLRLDQSAADTVLPGVTETQRLEALEAGIAELHQVGVVSVHEMIRESIELGDYLRLREQGRLGIRVRFYVRSVESATQLEHLLRLGLRTGFGDDWLRLGGMKISIDGWDILGTAAVYESRAGDDGNTGIIRVEPDVLQREMQAAHDGGIQIAIHACGERAVDLALDAYQTVIQKGQPNALRHRIEHFYLPARPGQLERLRDLGLLLSTQPSFAWATGDVWAQLYADEELARILPLRTALDLGIRVQANSDFPCSPFDPLLTVRSAVQRLTREGRQLGVSESVTVADALRMMTSAAAYSAFEEGSSGSIATGRRADLVLLSHDPTSMPVEELGQVRVDATVIGGRVVYEADPAG
jgi:predicted amidohydrolase YtcJ